MNNKKTVCPDDGTSDSHTVIRLLQLLRHQSSTLLFILLSFEHLGFFGSLLVVFRIWHKYGNCRTTKQSGVQHHRTHTYTHT